MVVGRLHVRVFLGYFVEGPFPEVASECQHVRLVDKGEVGATASGLVKGESDGPLHSHSGVDRPLGGHLVGSALPEEPALAGIGPLGVLPHHPEVDVPVRMDEGSQVHVQVEFKAHLEQ